MRVFTIIAALGAAFTLSSIPAPAMAADSLPSELDSADRRAELIGWEAVGRLDMAGAGTCSGALIAQDLVLTAAHCVVNDRGEKLDPKKILFRAGLRNGDAIASSRGRAIAIASGYKHAEDGQIKAAVIRRDVALIQLEKPVARALAQPFPIHRVQRNDGELMVASYGRGRNAAMSIQRECHNLGRNSGVLQFDCDITYGSSGAPVFAYDGPRPAIMSVVSAVTTHKGRKLGLGMDISKIIPELKREIALGAPQVATKAKPAVVKRITVGGSSAGKRKVGGAKFLSSN